MPETLPDWVLEQVKRRLAIEADQRGRNFHRELNKTISPMIAAGRQHSGVTVGAVIDAYGSEVTYRYRQALLVLQQAMAAFGGRQGTGFAERAYLVLRPLIHEQIEILRGEMRSHASFRTPTCARAAAILEEQIFNKMVAEAEETLQLDLEAIEAASIQIANQGTSPMATSANVHGSNNIVLVGLTSSTVSIRLDGQSKDAVEAAMSVLLEKLDSLGLPSDKATDIKELAEECSTLIKQEKPNKTKLTSNLQAIWQTVQIVTAAPDVVEAVRKALAYVGLSGGS
ncbi:hypothetical protein MVG78_13805 [Roseomonas gilardii subsp. gilardii]|uniref:hypothetical protein n=1 Tax=Roseomonas gilardii TaxID=257708 RepID=UPI001FFBE859|nr:hypothetical protein [Roseomonas gilardii]UPG71628.1 hypothetical protein MVG78_13805 [Roseomonas gilardii subsp. gilardii]